MMKNQATIAAVWIGLALGPVAGQTVVADSIQSIAPASAEQGSVNLVLTFTIDPAATPPPPAPSTILPSRVTVGTIEGSSLAHPSQYVVTATFTIPAGEAAGSKDAEIVFPGPVGTLTYTGQDQFEVLAATGPPTAGFTASPVVGVAPLEVAFTDTSTGMVTGRDWDFGDGASSAASDPAHTYTDPGTYTVSLAVTGPEGSDTLTINGLITVIDPASLVGTYPVVDTGQTACYDNSTEIAPPAAGAPFFGQDGQISGNPPSFTLSGDGLTVTDKVTGLVWQQSPERTGDGTIDAGDEIAWADIPAYVATLNAENFGGHNDWRLPTIKELYSLVDFRGTDPSGYNGTDTSGLTPFIDPAYFDFGWGDTGAGERLIDAQYWSGTEYVSTTMGGNPTVFGFNFADGRIKGYPRTKSMYLRCVRGSTSYGINHLADNSNGTVSDFATGLMWGQADSGAGMNWQDALAWVQARNAEKHLGFDDWRLPNAKELQTIVDYTRSPATHGTPAIDPVFTCTPITAEDGSTDYPFYWTGTTHATSTGSAMWAAYLCFGTAFGNWGGGWTDVHGAGAQRSDPKYDDGTDYSGGHGPQGDAVRIDNFVRLVRTMRPTDDSVGDGITDAWRRDHFGGTGTTTDADSAADSDPDADGCDNRCEFSADTDPNDPLSNFKVEGAPDATGFALVFQSSSERLYTLWRSLDMSEGSWEQVAGKVDLPGSGGTDTLIDPAPPGDRCFYRVGVAVP